MIRVENEPEKIEENGAEEQEGICPSESLIGALNSDEGEQGNPKMKEQYAIIEWGEGSNQCACNLSVDEVEGEPLKVFIASYLGFYIRTPQSTATTHHMPKIFTTNPTILTLYYQL